jgi:hypothetical protein
MNVPSISPGSINPLGGKPQAAEKNVDISFESYMNDSDVKSLPLKMIKDDPQVQRDMLSSEDIIDDLIDFQMDIPKSIDKPILEAQSQPLTPSQVKEKAVPENLKAVLEKDILKLKTSRDEQPQDLKEVSLQGKEDIPSKMKPLQQEKDEGVETILMSTQILFDFINEKQKNTLKEFDSLEFQEKQISGYEGVTQETEINPKSFLDSQLDTDLNPQVKNQNKDTMAASAQEVLLTQSSLQTSYAVIQDNEREQQKQPQELNKVLVNSPALLKEDSSQINIAKNSEVLPLKILKKGESFSLESSPRNIENVNQNTPVVNIPVSNQNFMQPLVSGNQIYIQDSPKNYPPVQQIEPQHFSPENMRFEDVKLRPNNQNSSLWSQMSLALDPVPGKDKFSLTLSAPEKGHLQFEFVRDIKENSLKATITVDQTSVYQQIQNDLPKIVDLLQNAGFDINKDGLNLKFDQNFSSFQSFGDSQQKGSMPRRFQGGIEGLNEENDIRLQQIVPSKQGLDLYI